MRLGQEKSIRSASRISWCLVSVEWGSRCCGWVPLWIYVSTAMGCRELGWMEDCRCWVGKEGGQREGEWGGLDEVNAVALGVPIGIPHPQSDTKGAVAPLVTEIDDQEYRGTPVVNWRRDPEGIDRHARSLKVDLKVCDKPVSILCVTNSRFSEIEVFYISIKRVTSGIEHVIDQGQVALSSS